MNDKEFHELVYSYNGARHKLDIERRRRFKVGMPVAIDADNYRGLGVIDGFPKQAEKMLVKVHNKKCLMFGCESVFKVEGVAKSNAGSFPMTRKASLSG